MDQVIESARHPWFWIVLGLGAFGFCSMMCGLLIWAFKPGKVSPVVRTIFHVCLAFFVLRRFVATVTFTPVTYDWPAAFTSMMMGMATFTLMAAIALAIERDELLRPGELRRG